MRFMFGFAVITLLSGTLTAQDHPLAPEAAAKAMKLPPGFKATLFAGEPDVVQPIAFTFDDRGRLWVVECLSYPKWRTDGKGNDRVVIFEDTDGDGKFDKRTVFYDKGSNLSGIEYGFGGIWLCSTPNLIFIPVRDDKPAGPPQVVLDGWDLKAKHNVFNSLAWGPDGWLYGCNGILSESRVGKPGTPDKDRVAINCGVWRYHPPSTPPLGKGGPVGGVFEAFAHGTTNPWGLDFNEDGEMFITNCVIKHIWHVVPGAHFERMFGQDLNPHVYKLMPSIADHIHWGGGDWTSSRGGKGVHDAAGGGHAHSGCMVYLGDNWPDEYRGNVFMCNIHGSRINRDFLERHGSTYVAKHGPDFMFANDPWFRGLTLKYGPDGGVFVTDWSDTGECHNYEKVDQTNGRIFKITYGDPKPFKGDLSKLSDLELVKLQRHRNEWFCRHARRLLQERAATGRIDPKAIAETRKMLENEKDRWARLRALWVLNAIGANDVICLADQYSEFQCWAIRLKSDEGNVQALSEVISHRRKGGHPANVRLAIASALQRVDPKERLSMINSALWRSWAPDEMHLPSPHYDTNDPYLPLMVWYAMEPVLEVSPKRCLNFVGTQHKLLSEFIVRRLVEGKDKNLDLIVDLLNTWLEWEKKPVFPETFSHSERIRFTNQKIVPVLGSVQAAMGGRRDVHMPSNWRGLASQLVDRGSDELKDRTLALSVIFGDKAAVDELHKVILDRSASSERRQFALKVLTQKQVPDLFDVLKSVMDDASLRSEAIRGLAALMDPTIPDMVLRRYPKLTDAERSDAVQTLASRPKFALALLDAVEKGMVARKDISPFVARQILALKDQQVSKRLATVWGTIRPASKERAALMARYKAILTRETLQKADPMKGKLVFAKNCASCHKLNGEGGAIAPDLTGSQRNNLDYLLENVLDPSAVVAREYTVTNIELKNGRTVSGLIAMETERALTMQTPNEKLIIAKADIETRTPTNVSMMPEGLFDKLSESELRDLVDYLMRK